ncbi:TonB-dependent receptor plug [Bacteroides coprosuis DSM 18011]|uniref:TonB-dependent receptor plug n=1 Tax=Bacteroides coprosuis DSM 18011 TaxID=679937 RepID=F3ZSC4_9BACE|nr:TonB-dependent receptor [Bacteroides coprosuis]EGJ70861.1 TonB-dependent receptor plug [Bacteroides coprosuis DSM 18011]
MKKRSLLGICILAGTATFAQVNVKDSMRIVKLEGVEVVSTRASAKTPVAFTNISKKDIKKQNIGKDIPFLISTTPSILTTSDAGAGIGYSKIRIRGTDATRINVTTNGIPMNDAESHELYWVNTPDLASSLEDIQVQRGVGTSTNGAGAFGASINMRTQAIFPQKYAEVSGSYGSFNSHKETFRLGTGLINDKWAFDARISNIQSDGYRDRASSDLKSYFLQGGYFGEKTSVKLITFGGKEETYHAWDGISKDMLKSNRRYNPNGEIEDSKGNVIGFYDNQIDHYVQKNYHLLINQYLSNTWNLNVGFHYTDGDGYYEEYKNKRSLKEYGLQPFEHNGETVKKSDLIRKKFTESRFGGGIFSFNHKGEKLQASLGGGLNYYKNDHFGKVLWVKNYIGDIMPDNHYYDNTGRKTDGNIYAKASFEVTDGLSLFADAQFRHLRYRLSGLSDKWNWTSNPEQLQSLSFDEKFNFFNPKLGLSWQINSYHSTYASFSVAQKEPTRSNYTDALFTQKPNAEKLYDYELGYTFNNPCFNAGVNLYYMDYKDQLVLNGKVNEIGRAISENVDKSYRMGIEISLGAQLTKWLRWDINGTWSKNRIKDYVAYFSDSNYKQHTLNWGDTPISFSPSFMGNSIISANYKGFNASFQTQYSTRQYLDNLGLKDNSLDPFIVNHIHLSYDFKLPYIKQATVGASVYNLFNLKYETNGYSQTSIDTEGQILSHDPRFYPMAGTNVLAHITLSF